jgi:hypothetical protein
VFGVDFMFSSKARLRLACKCGCQSAYFSGPTIGKCSSPVQPEKVKCPELGS